MVREDLISILEPFIGSDIGIHVWDDGSDHMYKMDSCDGLFKWVFENIANKSPDKKITFYLIEYLDKVELTKSDLAQIGEWFEYRSDEVECSIAQLAELNKVLAQCFTKVRKSFEDSRDIVEFYLASVYVTEDMLGKYRELR